MKNCCVLDRQLILYKLGYEKIWKEKIDTTSWFMIKYNYLKYNGKEYFTSRRKVVEQSQTFIKKQFDKQNYSKMVKDVFMDRFIESKSIEVLPSTIKKEISVGDCILRYDITKPLIDETINYVIDESKKIKARTERIEDWPPCDMKTNEFYCTHLCGQKNICAAYLKFLRGEL